VPAGEAAAIKASAAACIASMAGTRVPAGATAVTITCAAALSACLQLMLLTAGSVEARAALSFPGARARPLIQGLLFSDAPCIVCMHAALFPTI
jgi:hypothetical protein